MRQWMVDPEIMCQKHLCGEHLEHHMFLGTINKGTSIQGYLDKNLLEPKSLISRHNKLVSEMKSRGFNHKSEMTNNDLEEAFEKLDSDEIDTKIYKEAAANDLFNRCLDCTFRKIRMELESEKF